MFYAAEFINNINVKGYMGTRPTPIGLYFANLWYSEKLYPIIWTVEALGEVCQRFRIR